MPLQKILQVFDSFLLKEFNENFIRKPKSNPEFSARNEYAAVHVSAHGSENILNANR
jgi:hypothetical protein